jgi:hypothetical protein
MKKLMMMMAAGLAATALVAEVTSVNVVGYMTTSTPGALQYQMYTPMFVTVSGDTNRILLGSISPNQAFEDNGDTISCISAGGLWMLEANYASDYGWFNPNDEDFEVLDEVEIVSGTGFYVRTAGSGGALVCAGEVALGDLDVVLPGALKYAMVGNPTPVAITLGDIVPNQAFEDNGDTISFISSGGLWTLEANYASDYGWFNPNDEEFEVLDGVVLQPGDTFYVRTAGDGGVLTFPSPL